MSKSPFSKEDEQKIINAIALAESETSGEIRVHVDKFCKNNPLLKAINLFTQFKMNETELRNGVLIYISINDKKLAIYGDKGINEKVEDDFWESTLQKMKFHFANGNFAEGIIAGLIEAGNKLKTHFPKSDNDINELPDEITYN